MEKVSLWKRVGGWLRRSQQPEEVSEVVRLDAEGLLVGMGEGTGEDKESLPAPRMNKKEQQLAAMEDGFNRLVGVMESLNENVARQCDQNAVLLDRLEQLPDLLRSLPESGQAQQEMMRHLEEEFRRQGQRHEQLAEVMGALPELTEKQIDQLGAIRGRLEDSAQTDGRMLESFGHLDKSMDNVLSHNQAQTSSLASIGELLERGQAEMRAEAARGRRRVAWLLGIVLLVSLAAVGAALWVMLGGGGQAG